jgi:proteasome activator subunit 4
MSETMRQGLLLIFYPSQSSIQHLIRNVANDFIIRLAEPSTLRSSVQSEGVRQSAEALEGSISVPPDDHLLAQVAEKSKARVEQKDSAYDDLVRQ